MLKVFAIRDIKTASFEKPVVTEFAAEIIRDFGTLCKDPKTRYGTYPTDFELYQIGEYDHMTATMIPMTPTHLDSGANYVTPA